MYTCVRIYIRTYVVLHMYTHVYIRIYSFLPRGSHVYILKLRSFHTEYTLSIHMYLYIHSTYVVLHTRIHFFMCIFSNSNHFTLSTHCPYRCTYIYMLYYTYVCTYVNTHIHTYCHAPCIFLNMKQKEIGLAVPDNPPYCNASLICSIY